MKRRGVKPGTKMAPEQGEAGPSPCDDCGLRRTCAQGFTCKAYRRHLEGPPREKVLQWRGHKLTPVADATAVA